MVIDIQGKAAAAEEEGKTCLRREVELMGFAEALPLYTPARCSPCGLSPTRASHSDRYHAVFLDYYIISRSWDASR